MPTRVGCGPITAGTGCADVQVTGVSPRRGSFVVPGRPVVWLRALRGRAYVISFAGDGCDGSVTVRVRR